MGREFELKFRATPVQLAAMEAAFGSFQSISMETSYYDTPQAALGARRWTLRRRLENGVSVCTLKTPAPGGARGEWELQCDDIHSAIDKLCKLSNQPELKTLTETGLELVCAARFTRQACTVRDKDAVFEIALDQGVLLGGGREIPLCEAEVELKQGSDEDARTFAAALQARYGLVPERRSKYARALALAKNEL